MLQEFQKHAFRLEQNFEIDKRNGAESYRYRSGNIPLNAADGTK